MKRILFLLSIWILTFSFCNAQYRVNKAIYDTIPYSYQMGDPYNPTVMALSSAILPGLGQIFEGESGRGLGFMGGFLSLVVIRQISLRAPVTSLNYTQKDIIRWGTIAGRTLLRVWAAFDAAHVAGINNLAFRAKYKYDVTMHILPYPDIPENFYVTNPCPVGVTLIVSF